MDIKELRAINMSAKVKLAIVLSLVLFITLTSLMLAQFVSASYNQLDLFQLVKALKAVACLAVLSHWHFVASSELSSLSNSRYYHWEVAVFLLLHTLDGLVHFIDYDPVRWQLTASITLVLSAVLSVSLTFKQFNRSKVELFGFSLVVSATFAFILYSIGWNVNAYQLAELPPILVVSSILSSAIVSVLAIRMFVENRYSEYEVNVLLLLVALTGLFEIFGREGHIIWWTSAAFQLLFVSTLFGAANSLNSQTAGNLRLYKQGLNKTTSVHFCGNEKGHLVFVNTAFRELFGIDSDTKIKNINHPFVHHPIWQTIDNNLKKTGEWAGETMVRINKDKVISVYVEFSVLNLSGELLHQASLTNLQEKVELRRRGNVAEEKLERLSFELMNRQEDERRFFAKELHDEIGQGLTLLKIQHQLPEPDGKLINTVLAELIDKVRNMSLNLRPAILDDMGLSAALKWLVDRQTKFSQLKITSDIEEPLPRFDDKVEISVFRIVQEAFTNIHKYAHATDVILTCRLDGSYINVVIQDNGVGFDVDSKFNQASQSQSMGLISLRERAFSVNGQVTIESSPEFGTNVALRVPTSDEGAKHEL